MKKPGDCPAFSLLLVGASLLANKVSGDAGLRRFASKLLQVGRPRCEAHQ